jgi:two-component system sensor histidine kinase AgrC
VINVLNNILLIISSLFISFCQIYVWAKFYDSKINYKSFYFYFSIILLSLCGIITALFFNAYYKMIFVSFIFGFCNWLIFRKSLNEVSLSTLYSHLLLSISDAIGAAFLIILFGKDALYVRNNFFVSFVGNFLVSFVFLLFIHFKFVKKIYDLLLNLVMKFKFSNLLNLFLLVIISLNFFMAVIYYDIKSIYSIIINTIMILIYSFIVYKSLKEKYNRVFVKSQNEILMQSLHQYEDMVDRQRVDNHENKNQLLIIKNMIKKNDNSVVNYIDTIVRNQMEDDESLYTRVMAIPSGGLQGIVYQKMLVMKDENISFSLNVSRDVRNIDLEKLDMDDNYRLCKIIGVILDNAIEESMKILDKCIMISLFVDDSDLVIEVSNRFEGRIDIDLIDCEGYTTKGDGHGYGLSLVKKILSETDRFENIRSINKNIFKQSIRVRI